jgi:hypothetical protein
VPLLAAVLAACSSSDTGDLPDVAADATQEDIADATSRPCRIDKECSAPTECQIGVCDPNTKLCANTIAPGSCLVGGNCYATGAPDPQNACRQCDPTAKQDEFSFKPGNEGFLSETKKGEGGEIISECINPCERYCETISKNCTDGAPDDPTDDQQQYAGPETPDGEVDEEFRVGCLMYCSGNWLQPTPPAKPYTPVGGADEGAAARGTDAIACRQKYADGADKTGKSAIVGKTDAALLCPRAGASGGNLCGSWCHNYCQLTAQNCTSLFQDYQQCLDQCGALSTAGRPGDVTGDSVQCRIYFAGIAGVTGGGLACKEASIGATNACQNKASTLGDSCFNPLRIDHIPFFSESTTKGSRSDYRTPCDDKGIAQDSQSGGAPDQVWELKTEANVTYTVSLTPSFAGHVGVLRGTCGGLECFKASTPALAKETTTISFDSPEAGTYYVLVDGTAAGAGGSAGAPSTFGQYSISVERGPTCEDYCAKVTSVCNTEYTRQYGFAASEDPQAPYKECLAYCRTDAKLPSGGTNDSHGNTIGCRLFYTIQAAQVLAGVSECTTTEADRATKLDVVANFCRNAGRTGGQACGTPCDNYCHLAVTRCLGSTKKYSSESQCAKDCANFELGDKSDFNGDSQWCRLNTLAFAAVSPSPIDPEGPPTESAKACQAILDGTDACDGDCTQNCKDRECGETSCGKKCGTCNAGQRCNGDGRCVADCDRYCREANCNCGAASGFADTKECLDFCAEKTAPPVTAVAAATQLQCSTWFAGHSVDSSDSEIKTFACTTAGKTGWDQCATWCEAYCTLTASTCTAENELYATHAECLTDCAAYVLDDTALSADFPSKNGDYLQCRLRYALQSKVTPGVSCPAASSSGITSDGKKVCTQL